MPILKNQTGIEVKLSKGTFDELVRKFRGQLIYIPMRRRVDKSKVVKMRKAGFQINDISRQFEVSVGRVYQILSEYKNGKQERK